MPSATVWYKITDNGKLLGYLSNTAYRPDVNTAYRITGNHGLGGNLTVTTGTHTLCLTAVSTGALGTPLGCKTI
jgi:hypothetical protein